LTAGQKKFPSVFAGFTAKTGGISEKPFESFNLGLHVNDNDNSVEANRKKLAELAGFPPSDWICADQVHGSRIRKVQNEDRGKGALEYSSALKETDGLYTKEKGALLALCYADCVPVFFYDPQKELIGAVHAGWKGSVKDISGKMARTWITEEGSSPDQIQAVIGPSIGECCYVVDDLVINSVNDALKSSDSRPYEQAGKGQYKLNLKQLNKQLLINAGVIPENIQVSSYCTSCDSNFFFSHRRDREKPGGCYLLLE
jgi:polyphenol oxidase